MRKCLGSHLQWLPRKVPLAPNAAWNFIFIQNTSTESFSNRSFPKILRLCYRKGCANRFSPQRRYQKFCRDPGCVAELRRWQTLKRQRQHRLKPENRQKHAERERLRRLKKSQEVTQSGIASEPRGSEVNDCAWSRTTCIPKDFCDRPGCYEPKVQSHRNVAKYCGNACRNAAQRVAQRDRQYKTARYRWPRSSCFSPVNYSSSSSGRIPFPQPKRSNQHGSKTGSQVGPRSPPTQM